MQILRPEPGVVIADLPTVRCTMAGLEPGQSHDRQCHPVSDKVCLFLEGQGEVVSVDGRQVEAFEAPRQAYIPAGTSYMLRNTGARPLKWVWALAPNESTEASELSATDATAPVVLMGIQAGDRFPTSEKVRGGMVIFDPNMECPYHSHDGADEVFFFISGTGEVIEEGEVARVGPGDVVVTPAERIHKIRSFDETLVVWAVVTPNRVPSHTGYKELSDGSFERITPSS